MGLPFSQSDDPEREQSIRPSSEMTACRTRVTIDLKRFEKNVLEILSRLPGGAGLLPVIKANAYGHGLLPIVSSLLHLNIGQVAVMGLDEACLVRKAGYEGTVVLLGGFSGSELPLCLKYKLTPVLHHGDQIRYLESLSSRSSLDVHVKIDSGMGRLGFLPEELPGILDRIDSLKHVKIKGLMTHFPLSEDREDTDRCVQVFREALLSVGSHRALRFLEVVHMANSAAVMNGLTAWKEPFPAKGRLKDLRFWARPGLLLYGYSPSGRILGGWKEVRPILKVESRLLSVRSLPKGQTISYGRTMTLERNSRVGIVAMGYADGLPRGISGKGWAVVSGVRVPFLGRICMDMVAVDLTELSIDVSSGDWVSIIDPDHPESMTIELLAEWMNTIPYEILCLIGHRSERRYIVDPPRHSAESL